MNDATPSIPPSTFNFEDIPQEPTMNDWPEFPLLQDDYHGPMSLTERLDALERALTHAQASAKHLQAFIDEILSAIQRITGEMDDAR